MATKDSRSGSLSAGSIAQLRNDGPVPTRAVIQLPTCHMTAAVDGAHRPAAIPKSTDRLARELPSSADVARQAGPAIDSQICTDQERAHEGTTGNDDVTNSENAFQPVRKTPMAPIRERSPGSSRGPRYVGNETRTLVSTHYVESLLIPVQEIMADAIKSGELRNMDPGFLTSAFLEMANVVQGIPEDVAMPPDHRQDQASSREQLATQVVELFLSGARAS